MSEDQIQNALDHLIRCGAVAAGIGDHECFRATEEPPGIGNAMLSVILALHAMRVPRGRLVMEDVTIYVERGQSLFAAALLPTGASEAKSIRRMLRRVLTPRRPRLGPDARVLGHGDVRRVQGRWGGGHG